MKRAIGRTGINVHPIGYGAWPLSNVNRPPEEQALEVIARAVEAGVDLIDTADAYCLDEHDFGHNEGLIRKALDAIGDTGEVTVAVTSTSSSAAALSGRRSPRRRRPLRRSAVAERLAACVSR